MRKHQLQQTAVACAALLFALVATATPVIAQDSGSSTAVLVGQLYVGDDGGFLLIEKQSGEVVILKSEYDLSEYNKSTVRIEGKWGYTQEGARVFVVTAAEQA